MTNPQGSWLMAKACLTSTQAEDHPLENSSIVIGWQYSYYRLELHLEVVLGPDQIRLPDNMRKAFAVMHDQLDIVKSLIKLDIDLDLPNQWGESVIQLALNRRNEEILRMLLDVKADWSKYLFQTVSNWEIEAVEMLLECGAHARY